MLNSRVLSFSKLHVVMKLILAKPRDMEFSDRGDSGAWVLSRNRDLIGMLWGGFTSRDGGFMTPIKAITDDIES